MKQEKRSREGDITMEVQEVRVMQCGKDSYFLWLWKRRKGPWPKGCGLSLETREGNRFTLRASRSEHSSDFCTVWPCWTSKLQNCKIHKFLLFSTCLVFFICYSSDGKLIQTMSNFLACVRNEDQMLVIMCSTGRWWKKVVNHVFGHIGFQL